MGMVEDSNSVCPLVLRMLGGDKAVPRRELSKPSPHPAIHP